mmetsp:Transcript_22703/g.58053  ORF Transcript_22703/g.58053 Transcript_22703/m.58053 type:complete len:277 (+) Transcript_22703:750-1580(+)
MGVLPAFSTKVTKVRSTFWATNCSLLSAIKARLSSKFALRSMFRAKTSASCLAIRSWAPANLAACVSSISMARCILVSKAPTSLCVQTLDLCSAARRIAACLWSALACASCSFTEDSCCKTCASCARVFCNDSKLLAAVMLFFSRSSASRALRWDLERATLFRRASIFCILSLVTCTKCSFSAASCSRNCCCLRSMRFRRSDLFSAEKTRASPPSMLRVVSAETSSVLRCRESMEVTRAPRSLGFLRTMTEAESCTRRLSKTRARFCSFLLVIIRT